MSIIIFFTEAIRINGPVQYVSRVCKMNYKVPGTHVILDTGTVVILPFQAIYCDPEYYPNPENYDPKSFSKEHSNPTSNGFHTVRGRSEDLFR